MNTKVCSVTSKPAQNSSRRISSLKDTSLLLTTEWWTSQKWSPSNRQHTTCGKDWKYISEHKQNAHNDRNRVQPLKRVLETLFLAINKCTGSTTDVIWVNTKVCSVTSEPTQSSSRRVSSLKDSSMLLTIEWWTSQKWSSSNH